MFKIIALSPSFIVQQTDYPAMSLEEAVAIASELTSDALEEGSDQRWTVVPSGPTEDPA